MTHAPLDNPALTVGLALLVGVIAQVFAWHIALPGIVVLLAFGVLLGPDVVNVIRPDTLDGGLNLLVGFAVAIILFEGGLNLHIKRLRRSQKALRRLVTWGAFVTAVLATLAAKIWMGWTWNVSVMFGTLVIVTGPTVVGPLMRRLNVERSTSALLEGEGVLIDPIGAIVAVVAFEIALTPDLATSLHGAQNLVLGLGGGTLIGDGAGALISLALRTHKLVPESLVNISILAFILALFQTSEAIVHESGIAAVTVAGAVVRWMGGKRHTALEEIHHFKEQLTSLMIGMLFVLLAADVRIADVRALGWNGVWCVLTLMFVVRPACVFIGTLGGGLRKRQILFMSWIGPRGIVAAAVASLFAVRMNADGVEGGAELRALVFLVITITVVTAGLTGGVLARALGLRRRSNTGWLIMGAQPLGRKLAQHLKARGVETVLLDRNPEAARRAQEEGLHVIYGNALEERTLRRAEVDTRSGALSVTRNEEVNMLFATNVRHVGKLEHILVALDDTREGVTATMVHEAGSSVLFGRGVDTEYWGQRIKRKHALEQTWIRHADVELKPEKLEDDHHLYLPLIRIGGGKVVPFSDDGKLKIGDEVLFIIDSRKEADAVKRLKALGFRELKQGGPAEDRHEVKM